VRRLIVPNHARGRRAVAPRSTTVRRGEHELLRRRDLEVVGWLAEQYSGRVDHVEVLLGVGPRTVQRTLARLRAAGLIRTERVLVGEPAWVLPTAAGMTACNSGFGVWRPRIGLLAHVAAVNDVRLHVQGRALSTEWISERVLARDRLAGEHLPDGVAIVDGRRVAIEVELTLKSRRRITAILDDLAAHCDAVLYWCAPSTRRQLTELAGTGRWPTFGVRELPRPEDREQQGQDRLS
jgi:DNA-binding transcriptional ArsR family regulator